MPFFRRPRRDSDVESEADVEQTLFKVLVLGAPGAGKTSIIKQYVHKFFSQDYKITIGIDFALKEVQWNDNTLLQLQLWDIAGQERYTSITRSYYRGAHGALIVFDETDSSSFQAVHVWKHDLDSKVQLADGSPLPCVLMANKCDVRNKGLTFSHCQMDEFCKEEGFLTWFETSAKWNINIKWAVRCLIKQMLKKQREIQTEEREEKFQKSITLDNKRTSKRDKSKCC